MFIQTQSSVPQNKNNQQCQNQIPCALEAYTRLKASTHRNKNTNLNTFYAFGYNHGVQKITSRVFI